MLPGTVATQVLDGLARGREWRQGLAHDGRGQLDDLLAEVTERTLVCFGLGQAVVGSRRDVGCVVARMLG